LGDKKQREEVSKKRGYGRGGTEGNGAILESIFKPEQKKVDASVRKKRGLKIYLVGLINVSQREEEGMSKT